MLDDFDDDYVEIGLGFDFPFYGQNYDTLYLSTNGHIDFVNGLEMQNIMNRETKYLRQVIQLEGTIGVKIR